MDHIVAHVAALESDPTVDSRDTAVHRLRELGLGDFASVLWGMPDKNAPKLSHLLPKMASEDVQLSWTGASGDRLLSQTLGFIRSVSENYCDLTGHSLRDKRILDFGCGYGRNIRSAMYYSDDVWGVDPWDESLKTCMDAGLNKNIIRSQNIPCDLPVPTDFDLVIALSIFTHLSERTTRACLQAIRKHLKKGGIACITIRPIEYWRVVYGHFDEHKLGALEEAHINTGFAFFPHNRPPIDGEITYGDTSMSLEKLKELADGLSIAALDRLSDDPVQRIIFLKAV